MVNVVTGRTASLLAQPLIESQCFYLWLFSRSVSSNPTTRQLSVQTSLDKPQEAQATPLPQLLLIVVLHMDIDVPRVSFHFHPIFQYETGIYCIPLCGLLSERHLRLVLFSPKDV